MRLTIQLLMIIFTVLFAGASQTLRADANTIKVQVCFGCHGTNGDGTVNPAWPVLAGQHAGYIAKQLADFKTGIRSDPLMTSQTANLSKNDMAELGKFFAVQKVRTRPEVSSDTVQIKQGEIIYNNGSEANGATACVGCHGPMGRGDASEKIPLLRGQNTPYTVKALKDFRIGARKHESNSRLMTGIAADLTDNEIDSVASYISTLH